MRYLRLALAIVGIGLATYGIGRLVVQLPVSTLVVLAAWLAAAVIIHDGVVSPLVIGIGWGLRRLVPDRARRHLQAALVVGGMVTVVAIPLTMRQFSQPPSKALLLQSYGWNLTVLLGLIGGISLVGYAVAVARDRRRTSTGGPR